LNRAAGGRIQSGQQPEQSGLAGPGWPHHRDVLAASDVQVDAAQDFDAVRARVDGLRHAAQGKNEVVHRFLYDDRR
jgi:hypothetical protein